MPRPYALSVAGSQAAAVPRAAGSGYRWTVLALATVMQVGISMPQQTPAAIGPVLTRELALSRSELGLLTSAIWGGMLLGMLVTGVLADRFGERRVIAAGGVLLGVVLLAAAQANAFPLLFALLLVAAFGSSSASPGGTKAIAAWFPPRQRGMAMGVRQMGVTASGVIASVLLPPIAVAAHWQAAFRTVAVIALATTAVFSLFYRESPAVERVEQQPGGLRQLLRNRTFIFGTAYAWVFMGALGSAVAYLGVAMHQQIGVSPIGAGYLLAVLQLGGISGRLGWGLLSDRLGRRAPAMVACGLLTLVACVAMSSVHGSPPLVLVAALAFLLGLAAMGWNALYLTLVSDQVPVRSAATSIGAGLTISFSGMFIVTPLFGLVADHAGSYAPAWLALAAWALIGTALGLGIRETRRA
jgi:MFS family permease